MTYPPEAICAFEGCGHRFDRHEPWMDFGELLCKDCATNAARGFDVEDSHSFVPRRLAGGALTPSQERVAYERAMRKNQ